MTTTDIETRQYSDKELQALADRHIKVLEQTVRRIGFRNLPEEGVEAIKDGIVTQSDPSWVMSDATGACDGYRLTDLGQQITEMLGWTCKCAGCLEIHRSRGWGPALAIDQYCSRCDAGIKQYGTTEFKGEPSCRYDRRELEYMGIAEPMLTINHAIPNPETNA